MTAAAATTPAPPRLIPDAHIEWSDPFPIPLEFLPADDLLVGPPPGKDLVALIEAYGQMEPIQVRLVRAGQDPAGRYDVLGGRRRVKAMRILNARHAGDERFARVRAVLRHERPGDNGVLPSLLDMVGNAARKDNPLSDLLAIRAALAELGEDEGAPSQAALSAISHATGMPYAKLLRRLRLVKLEPRLLAAAAAGQVSVANAEALARLPLATQRDLADGMEDGGERITTEAIHEASRARRADGAAKVQLSMGSAAAPTAGVRNPGVADIATYLVGKLDLALKEAGATVTGPGRFTGPNGKAYTVSLAVEEDGGAQGG